MAQFTLIWHLGVDFTSVRLKELSFQHQIDDSPHVDKDCNCDSSVSLGTYTRGDPKIKDEALSFTLTPEP
jgi:hypothetical protein